MASRAERREEGDVPPSATLLEIGGDLFLACDARGHVAWSDRRAGDILDARPGRPFVDLVAPFNRSKAGRFLDQARAGRTDAWELICAVGGEDVLLAMCGTPYQDGVLVAASRLPQRYVELHERLTATLNEIATLHRESTRQRHDLAHAHAALERASQSLGERARLEGVLLSARELAHLLNNDLTLPVGLLDLLRAEHDIPATAVPTLDAIADGLDVAVRHVAQFLRIVRVVIKETPQGPSLDLDRSSGSRDERRLTSDRDPLDDAPRSYD